jgi:hypothetical protein
MIPLTVCLCRRRSAELFLDLISFATFLNFRQQHADIGQTVKQSQIMIFGWPLDGWM